VFGGALRQAGVVAAAGIIALESMVERLAEDHANARRMAEGFAGAAPDGSIPLERVQTNMVVFDASACATDAASVIRALRHEGVLAGPMSENIVRFVTHHDVSASDVDRAIEAFARVVKALGYAG
jgi:threonine aldolase